MSRYKEAINALYEQQDQEAVIRDLTDFFGPRNEHFLKLYEKKRDKGKKNHYAMSISWATFLTGFVWFFYRRMYLWGILAIALPVGIGILFELLGFGDGTTSGAAIALAIVAKNLYVDNALKHLAMADEKRIFGDERSAYLQQAGGVSNLAGGIALAVFVLMIASIFLTRFPGSGPTM